MNLKSLARTLGISKTTVSRALNGYPEVNALTRERVLAAAMEAGYEANPMADRRSGYQAMQQLLAAAPRPTAVIVDNHLSGVGAVRALLDARIESGKEMSVIVWGSVEDSLVGSNVTTIDQPDSDQAGARMIEMLMAVVGGADPTGLQVLWQPTLLSGATVGPCSQ